MFCCDIGIHRRHKGASHAMSGRGRSHYRRGGPGGRRGPHTGKHHAPSSTTNKDQSVDETDPVIKTFRGFQKCLDDRNDRYERLVKFGRDVTIESKRIIFLLHRAFTAKGQNDQVQVDQILDDAWNRVTALKEGPFRCIADECQYSPEKSGIPYVRAYSPGLQEFIEAFSMYHFARYETLPSWEIVKDLLSFEPSSPSRGDTTDVEHVDEDRDVTAPAEKSSDLKASSVDPEPENTGSKACIPDMHLKEPVPVQNPGGTDSGSDEKSQSKDPPSSKETSQTTERKSAIEDSSRESHLGGTDYSGNATSAVQKLEVAVPAEEYLLGVLDVGGELMRACVGCITSNAALARRLCGTARALHHYFRTAAPVQGARGIGAKLRALSESVAKMEKVCYLVQVRGEELPKSSLLMDLVVKAQPSSGMGAESQHEYEDTEDFA